MHPTSNRLRGSRPSLGLVVLAFIAASCGGATAHASAEKGAIDLTDRAVEINGSINMGSIKRAQQAFLRFDQESHEPIWLKMNSPGGSVEAGLILIDTFLGLKSPIYCLVESKAYSMAAITLLFCKKKYAYRHATIMLHEASYGTMGEDPSNRSRLDFLTKYLDRLHNELAGLLKMPHDKYRQRIRDGWWLLADEAEKVGIIDSIVTKLNYSELSTEQREDKSTTIVRKSVKTLPERVAPSKIPKRRD